MKKNYSKLQFCMLHCVGPIVLYSHGFQAVQKGIVIQAVHFIGVVLNRKYHKIVYLIKHKFVSKYF